MFIGCLQSDINTVDHSNEWFETLTLNNNSVKFQLDTGAKCNTIPTTIYKSLNLPCQLNKSNTLLNRIQDTQLKYKGQ